MSLHNAAKELKYRLGVVVEEFGKAIANIGAEMQRKTV